MSVKAQRAEVPSAEGAAQGGAAWGPASASPGRTLGNSHPRSAPSERVLRNHRRF